ncbi:hypothetical protein N8455_00640, partial [Candidatus Gracilibacteria bacterium]|nr:hypothetical protein [Candidatus Gracilibacteria bacterium]
DYSIMEDEKNTVFGEIKYSLPELLFSLNIDDNRNVGSFDFEGKWNSNNTNFDSFSITSELSEKGREYDYDSGEYIYSGVNNKIFDADYELENGSIDGALHIYSDGVAIITATTQGNYKKNKLSLENNILFDDSYSQMFSEENSKIDIDINFSYDYTYTNYNNTLDIDVQLDDTSIGKLQIENISKKTYKETTVIETTDTILFDELAIEK